MGKPTVAQITNHCTIFLSFYKPSFNIINMATKADFQLTVDVFARGIYRGELDEHLDRLATSIRNRREALANGKRGKMEIGSIVYLNNTTRPAYLQGAAVEVVKFNTKKIVVNMVNPIGKWDKNVRVPLSLISLEKV